MNGAHLSGQRGGLRPARRIQTRLPARRRRHFPALNQHGLTEPPAIRGESAYLVESPDEFLAHVEEGLGTKNLVADAILELTGKSYYENIGIDTVATIVNDLVTTGALPISIAMHAAVGDSAWFANTTRAQDLARGFAEGCRRAVAVWGGGETPALKGIVDPKTILLAGSAIGRIRPKSNRMLGNLTDGDAIILLASTGVHTNGLTLCRDLAQRLPRGYLTPIEDGRTYGEALLDASAIYVPFVAECQRRQVPLKYASAYHRPWLEKIDAAGGAVRLPDDLAADRAPDPPFHSATGPG